LICRTLPSSLIVLSLCFVATTAVAHVTVWPRESPAGGFEKYTVRVPTEGKIGTTALELQVPEGLTVVSIAASNESSYELKRSGERIVAITWSRSIKPGEFAEFAFMARNPKEGAQVVWKAVQRFSDGSSTEWAGAAGSLHPASGTKLTVAVAHDH
jgi:uncharacterized protein YcnI